MLLFSPARQVICPGIHNRCARWPTAQMRGARKLPFAIQKPVGCGIADGHREHEQRTWNDRWARNRNVEVSAPGSDEETDGHSNHEFHRLLLQRRPHVVRLSVRGISRARCRSFSKIRGYDLRSHHHVSPGQNAPYRACVFLYSSNRGCTDEHLQVGR